MKMEFSALVDNAAGKDGDLMIRRSRSGPVAAPRPVGRDAQAERRTLVRANLTGGAIAA